MFTTSNWADSEWKLQAPFLVDGQPGLVEVVYLLKMPTLDEGPFMQEERDLIDSIAEMVRIYLEQQLAIGELKRQRARLSLQNQSLLKIVWTQSHEVRRPLANMLGLVDMLREAPSAPELLAYLDQEAQAFDRIIQGIIHESEQALQAVNLEPLPQPDLPA